MQDIALPVRLGPTTLMARIGAGGMGIVYYGVLGQAQTPVAVKVIRAELADAPEFRARFRREIELMRRVRGVCTARVHAADPDWYPPYLATEFLAGPTLADWILRNGPVTGPSLRTLAVGLAEALLAVHRAGVVHRDLKPGNVLLTQAGPKVVDFGIALATDVTVLTRVGTPVGTPGYMSPEQLNGIDVVGPPADVFAWGCTVAYAATGRIPFGAGPTDAVLFRVRHDPPNLVGIPDDLAGLVAETLRKDPAARPDAAELLRRLLVLVLGPDWNNGAAAPGASATDADLARGVLQVLDRNWPIRAYLPPPPTATATGPAPAGSVAASPRPLAGPPPSAAGPPPAGLPPVPRPAPGLPGQAPGPAAWPARQWPPPAGPPMGSLPVLGRPAAPLPAAGSLPAGVVPPIPPVPVPVPVPVSVAAGGRGPSAGPPGRGGRRRPHGLFGAGFVVVVAVAVALALLAVSLVVLHLANRDDDAGSAASIPSQQGPTVPAGVSSAAPGGGVSANAGPKGADSAGAPVTTAGHCRYVATAGANSKSLPPSSDRAPTGTSMMTILTNAGPITAELDAALAPCAVYALHHLAGRGYYNGSFCPRETTAPQEPYYVLQCGDPSGTGSGTPGFAYAAEHPASDFRRGVVAIARSESSGMNGAQFVISYADPDQAGLDEMTDRFTVVGRVIEGFDVLDDLVEPGVVGGGGDGPPASDARVRSVTIES